MKNYYEMLEIDKHASKEIIEKARSLMNKQDIDIEELLKKIYDDKIEIEKEKEEISKNLNQIQVLKKNLQRDDSKLKMQEQALVKINNEKIGTPGENIKCELGGIIPELGDIISDDSPDMVDVVMKKEISHIVEELIDNSDLTETERKIVEMYYGLNGNDSHTLEEISVIIKDKHKLTRERIRKIRDKALEKMKCCPNSDILLSAKTCIGDEPMFYPVYRRIRK